MRKIVDPRGKILKSIRDSMRDRGYPPTIQEIADTVGLASKSSVAHHLRTLQQEGRIERVPGRPRALVVHEPPPRHLHAVGDDIRPELETALRRGLRTVADQILPENGTATPAGTRAAATRHVKETRVMTKCTESTRRPWETNVGDVIVRHPDRPEQEIEARITAPYRYDGYTTWLDYEMPDGSIGVFRFDPGQLATLRGVTYVVEALLTDTARERAYQGLSPDDLGVLAAHVRDLFPEIFDSAMAALGRRNAALTVIRDRIDEATKARP